MDSLIGIPYAYVDLEPDDTLVHVCPVCGDRIPERTDSTGETTTNNYGVHYAAKH